jgi:hypothetical protein
MNTMTLARADEIQPELKGESLAELMERQTLRVQQVVEVAAGIARELALMHHQGLTYGALDSRNVRIWGGRASLAPKEPAVGGGVADDIRDFGVWLRELAEALPAEYGDKPRIALGEIAGRYLQAGNLAGDQAAGTQMKKAAMALSMWRVARLTTAAGEPALVGAREPAAYVETWAVAPTYVLPVKAPRKGKVLLLVRKVSAAEGNAAVEPKSAAPLRKATWYATAVVSAGFVGFLIYFTRGIL